MRCAVCGIETVSLTEHRVLGTMLAALIGSRSLLGVAMPESEVGVHPGCCLGGCDSPEDHD